MFSSIEGTIGTMDMEQARSIAVKPVAVCFMLTNPTETMLSVM